MIFPALLHYRPAALLACEFLGLGCLDWENHGEPPRLPPDILLFPVMIIIWCTYRSHSEMGAWEMGFSGWGTYLFGTSCVCVIVFFYTPRVVAVAVACRRCCSTSIYSSLIPYALSAG